MLKRPVFVVDFVSIPVEFPSVPLSVLVIIVQIQLPRALSAQHVFSPTTCVCRSEGSRSWPWRRVHLKCEFGSGLERAGVVAAVGS